ncbi:MAG: DUF3300 domain-containing protein [Pseudomonadota bacterium]
MGFDRNATVRPLAALVSLSFAAPALALIPGAAGNGLPCGGTVLIEAGDTLTDVANYCGVSIEAIVAVNAGVTADNVRAGQSLTIPGAVPVAAESAGQLNELLAPIALYPDALLAEMLTAATYPLELVQAHRWVQANGSGGDPSDQEWAPSVAAMTRYPDVLATMSNDLDWSIRLGDAFLADPDGVFDTIQDLRSRARDVGNLSDNEQQRVIVEAAPEAPLPADTTVVEYVEPVVEQRTIIRIVPRYDTLFVPQYHPRWVYAPYSAYSSFYYDPVITFGAGFAVGSWLTHFVDWRYRHVSLLPFGYRDPFFFYGPRLHYSFNTRLWSPWVHAPFHRRGFRYVNVPRVRINQGQRHLVNVVPSARGRAISRAARADYRVGQRRAALARGNYPRQARGTNARRAANNAGRDAIANRLANSRRASPNANRATSPRNRSVPSRAASERRDGVARQNWQARTSNRASSTRRQAANRASNNRATGDVRGRTSARASNARTAGDARARLLNRMDQNRGREAAAARNQQRRGGSSPAPQRERSAAFSGRNSGNRAATRSPQRRATTGARTTVPRAASPQRGNAPRTQNRSRVSTPRVRQPSAVRRPVQQRAAAPSASRRPQQQRSRAPAPSRSSAPSRRSAPSREASPRRSAGPSRSSSQSRRSSSSRSSNRRRR